MNDTFGAIVSVVVGVALGLMFFYGLWWTIRRGLTARLPALWFLTSLIVRMGLATFGIYLVSGGDLSRLLLSLSGFLIGRLLVTRLTGRSGAPPTLTSQAEANHAPQP